MNHQDAQELLGAYALDAVDHDEAARLENHLAECPSCRAEVQAHRETVAKLGTLGGDAPPQIWDRIAGGLTSEQPPKLLQFRRRPRAAAPIAALLAAAAAIVVLGVSTLHLQHQVNALRGTVGAGGLQQAAADAVLNPNHTVIDLTSSDGRLNAQVVDEPGGQAYLVSSDLPALGNGHTYQLWGLAQGQAVSLGLLGDQPRLAAFRIDTAVTQLMVTAEPAGGRPAPDSPVLIQGAV